MSLTLIVPAEEGWEARVSVPARVHYKQASAEQNRPTVTKVKAYFDGGDELLSQSILICGPFLWKRLAVQPKWVGKGIPSTTRVDGLELQGRAFHKDPSLTAMVLGELRQELQADGGFKIRKLNPQELDLLWTLWGFDSLEDPLLLLESPHHRLVLIFAQGNLMQVDDFYQAQVPKRPSSKGAHPFVQETANDFWSRPPHNVKADELISGEGIQILSDDDTIHQSLTTNQFIEYTKGCMEARKTVLGGTAKKPRNVSVQVELRPDGDFFTVVSDPPLGTDLEGKLKQALARVPHPPVRSVVALQFFCRVWGGK